jgi:hypothetical protein
MEEAIMMQRYAIAAAAIALAGSLGMAATTYAASPNPDLVSASTTEIDGGMEINWTITMTNLVPGSTMSFEAGPAQNNLIPLELGGKEVAISVTSATQTFTFTSDAPDYPGTNYPAAIFYLGATEATAAGPLSSNILNLVEYGQMPEVPWAAALPVVMLGAGAWMWMRRRRDTAAVSVHRTAV